MRILIVGAGGVGGYFGARLIQAGADVTYLLRDKRDAQIRAQGLRVETPGGAFTVAAQSVTTQTLAPDFDLLVLTCKAFDLPATLAALTPAASRGVLLPLLNGYTHLAELDAHWGRERVMAGVAQIAAELTSDGVVRQLTSLHALTVGPRTAGQDALARDFYGLCERAAFDASYSPNIEHALWVKWVFLATLAGMTTVCDGSIGQIRATPYGEALAQQMYAECCSVAHANGEVIAEGAQRQALATLTEAGSAFTASMLRDLRAAHRTEHEHILGQMIRRGAGAGVACPLLKLAYTRLAVAATQRPT